MRKEQLFAIFLGSVIGIVTAFVLWRSTRARQTPQPAPTQVEEKTTNQVVSDLSIVSPQNFAVLTEDVVAISGLATPGSTIIVTDGKVYTTKANASGEFSLNFELASGINQLKVLSFSQEPAPKSQELTLIFTTKIENASSQALTALVGAVTDIAEDTIQIRGDSGEIKQISISEETSYGSVVDDAREISFSDLAIGDFVANLGHTKEGKVFEAFRVLVTTQTDPVYLESKTGIIKTLNSKEFLVTESDSNEEISIDARGKVEVYSAREEELKTIKLLTAQEGDRIVVVGELDEGELIASTIILL